MNALKLLAVPLVALGLSVHAQAGLILVDNIDLNGTGLGAVLTLVTAQGGNGAAVESGCVAWDGSTDVVGTLACTSGFEGTGGDEKTGASQTLTRELSELTDISTIADIALIFNLNETGQDKTVTLEDLYFTVFDGNGAEVFSAFLVATEIALDQDDEGTGTGGSGFTFILDDAQRLLAATAETTAGGLQTDWRVGAGFLASDFNSGGETVFLFRVPGDTPPPGEVPEPSTMLLFGAGLLAAAHLRRRKAL